ncbi:rhomboid family intramembrane serine protease [Candidatus Woesearchaeota archaeon]|nr:rhomboid family intramembrane serine protease [Candidatus Woesearchaeota archaeon]
MASGFKSASVILIGINVVMFFLQLTLGGIGGWFTDMFMLVPFDILSRPWTLVTSMFLHGGPGHLMFNMYALLLFGTLIEQRIGWKRFLGLYFGAGILAGLGHTAFSMVMGANLPAVGASGGIMGVLGMTIMLLPHLRVLFFFIIPMSMRTAGILFALIDLLGVFGLGIPGIANMAHLVGLAAGVAYGAVLLRAKKAFTKKFVNRGISAGHGPAKKRSAGHRSAGRGSTQHTASTSENAGIELSREEIDEYIKTGRL